jgi:hypothetical protein
MPIYRLLKNHAFGPDDVEVLARAFEAALSQLQVTDRNHPTAELVAKRIFELAQQGERNPDRLRELG